MITFIGFDQVSPGGGQQLVINLASGLYYQGNIAKIYCSKESFVYNSLVDLNVDFVHIDSDIIKHKDISLYIHFDDVVVLMFFSIKLLCGLRNSNPKLIFYSIYPEIFSTYSSVLGIPIKSNLLSFIYSLDNAKALFFMDFSNYKTLHEFCNFTSNDISFIPIPIEVPFENSYIFKPKNKHLVITYIGRGDQKWKIYPVVKIYNDLIKSNLDFELQIITTETYLFSSMLSPYLKEIQGQNVTYVTGLSGTSLTNYLAKNSNLHFSMGTSALEAAKLGIPTILLDYSHTYFPNNYLYRWIFEENETFNLGFLIKPFQIFKGVEMKEIINLFNDPQIVHEISIKCFEYCKLNHSLYNSVKVLTKASNETSYRIIELFNDSLYLKIKKNVLLVNQKIW